MKEADDDGGPAEGDGQHEEHIYVIPAQHVGVVQEHDEQHDEQDDPVKQRLALVQVQRERVDGVPQAL